MSKVKICDICGEEIGAGYRKIKSKYSDGSLYRLEHICDDCWDKLSEYILNKENKD